MYGAMVKIEFGLEAVTGEEAKDLAALCQRIRKRFKVAVRSQLAGEHGGFTGLAIAALGAREQELRRLIEAVIAECEASGFGRVIDEQGVIEHIDHFFV